MNISFNHNLGKLGRYIKNKEHEIIHVVPLICFSIILAIALPLWVSGLLSGHILLDLIFMIIGASIAIFWSWKKTKIQTGIIAITARYLLEKEETMIDELLGILISGKWHEIKIDPIKEFYRTLKDLCLTEDYEIRRRIAEAVPALSNLNFEETKELVRILRIDWDVNRWKSDNRRRTIESLPNMIKRDVEFVKECLHIIEKDEMFTIIAITEVMDILRKDINQEEVSLYFNNLITEMRNIRYTQVEINTINEIWRLLSLIRYHLSEAISEVDNLKDSGNIYIQIAIARNIKWFFQASPDKAMSLISWFIQKERHKNVRRPMAREGNVDFLINSLKYGIYNEKAKEILWNLFTDEDAIIRITAFDKIDGIVDIDAEFAVKILLYIIEKNNFDRLVRRAKNYMVRKFKTA